MVSSVRTWRCIPRPSWAIPLPTPRARAGCSSSHAGWPRCSHHACGSTRSAAAAEADAVKFQTFRAERLALPDAPKAAYQLAHTDSAESAHAMLSRLELSPAAHRDLAAYCQERGILFLSTPFDEASADLLFE